MGGGEEGVEREEEVVGIKRRENQLAGPPSGGVETGRWTGRDGMGREPKDFIKIC